MELISNYMHNDDQRGMLNELTRKTFFFDFEDWVRGGFCEGDYIPFSFVEGDKMLSNASANIMKFRQNGVQRNYIQIGTVMTDPEHRNKKLAGTLIRRILEQFDGKCDGFYLFANLGALEFYRKLGFHEATEYRWSLRPEFRRDAVSAGAFRKAEGERLRAEYIEAVRSGAEYSAMEQLNRFSLQMFYTADLSDVYYAEDIDCFAVMERDGGTLHLKSVVSRSRVPLSAVISHISWEFHALDLGFTPCPEEAGMFICTPYNGGNDYRLFFMGNAIKDVERNRLMFPELSHA